MFWYTKKYNRTRKVTVAGILCLTAVTLSCTSASKQEHNTVDPEIDIPAFFKNEISFLNAENPNVTKTVKKDSLSETKQLVITDWDKELANFSSIDINKPAYRGTYDKDSVDNRVTYNFKDSSVDLSVVQIVYVDGAVSTLNVKRSTKNLLYNTVENLEYIKGKSYRVEKIQNVKVMGSQHYLIEGIIE